MKVNIRFFLLLLSVTSLNTCGRISLTGIHPVPSSIVDSGRVYGPDGSLVGDEDVGLYSSIVLDPNVNPLISYYDRTNTRLKFAYWNPRDNKWEIEIVDDDGDVGAYTSLALAEDDGSVWVSYYDRTRGALKVSSRTDKLWKNLMVDDGGPADYDVGRFSSLAFSPSGDICISYQDSTNGDLMFACWDRKSYDLEGMPAWTIDVVDAYPDSIGGETGMYSSLKFSSSAVPYIAYYDASKGDPKLAFKTEAGWSKITVGEKVKDLTLNVDPVTKKATLTPPSTFVYSEITVKKDGTPLEPEVGFTLDAPDEVTIIDYDPASTYTADYITSPDEDGTWIRLAFNSAGAPAVGYHNGSDGTLRYAELDTESMEWKIEVVDAGGVGTDISLAFTPDYNPVLTYFDNANMDLKVAFRSGNQWIHETVDTPGITGLWTSSVIDSKSILHVSYYQTLEPMAGDLKYMKWLIP